MSVGGFNISSSVALLSLLALGIANNAEVDLDGKWDFRVDPSDVGEKEKWFDTKAMPNLGSSISSPAAWQSQGVGNATNLLTHQYVGVAWYRKSVTINQSDLMNGRRIFLWIGGGPGGVMRSATIYANGHKIGRHIGYWKPVEMDLTYALKGTDGSFAIAVAVDSRWNSSEETLWGSGSFFSAAWDGYSYGGYGGIIGHASLLLRDLMWIHDSVHVETTPLVSKSGGDWKCSFRLQLAGTLVANASIDLRVVEWSPGGSGMLVAHGMPVEVTGIGQQQLIHAFVNNAKLWFPGGPTPLYYAIITLKDGSGALLSEKSIRFGIRKLELKGSKILWNGERLYLKGYGDDDGYGHSVSPPIGKNSKDYYASQLRAMQPFGFNFIRLHSHALPHEFFEACDELGFLVDVEMPMTYNYGCTGFCPGPLIDEVTSSAKLVYNQSLTSFVQSFNHHPSVFAYVLSNEVSYDTRSRDQFAELYRFAKAFDPDRPCWWADGAVTATLGPEDSEAMACKGTDISNQWCFADILVHGSMWAHTPNSSDGGSGFPADLPIPSIVHEGADQRSFPRLQEQLHTYSGAIVKAGVWLDQPISDMTALGLIGENELWSSASEGLYTLTMKAFLENWLLDAATSGFEWWTGFDFYGTSNGLMGGDEDYFYPKSGIDVSAIAAVQSEVAILIPTPVAAQKTGWEAGTHVSFDLVLSNLTFAGRPRWGSVASELIWELVLGLTVLQRVTVQLPVGCVPQGNATPVAKADFVMPNVTQSETVNFKARVAIGGTVVAHNQWHFGIFPKSPKVQACGVPVYVSSAQTHMLNAVRQVCSEAQILPASGIPGGDSYFVVLVDSSSSVTKELVVAANRVGGVLLLLSPADAGHLPICEDGGGGVFPLVLPSAFRQSWWMSGGTVGTLVYNHSELTSGLGSFLDFRWQGLVDKAWAYTLDHVADAKVHIRSLPAFEQFSGGASHSQIHNIALVWEAALPKIQEDLGAQIGRYIVSGLKLEDSPGQIRQMPQAMDMLRRLMHHATSLAGQPLKSVKRPALRAFDVPPPPAFCAAGDDAACQHRFNQSVVEDCFGNYKIVQPVSLDNSSGMNDVSKWIDAVHVHVRSSDTSAKLRAVIYSATQGGHWYGCGSSRGVPAKLLAAGEEVGSLPAGGGWVRLPLGTALKGPLQPGIYWIGALFSGSVHCYGVPGGGNAGVDIFNVNAYSAGPSEQFGPPTTGGGSIDVYATFTPKPDRGIFSDFAYIV